jgi:hypothetical protein
MVLPALFTNGESTMNSNQRSQPNNQSDNGGNERSLSSSRGGEEDKLNDSQQSAAAQKQGSQKPKQGGSQPGSQSNQDSTDRSGSQTGSEQQGGIGSHTPGTGRLAADDDMDDDTGLSNRANRQSADVERGNQQSEQSNVGRRSDGTPD